VGRHAGQQAGVRHGPAAAEGVLAHDDSRTEARDTPYAKLIRNPNPQHDPFFFWLHVASTFEVYGEALLLKNRPACRGAAPRSCGRSTRPGDDGPRRRRADRYFSGFGARASYIEWPAEDIVHFRSYNPDDQVRGLSRLEPLRATLLNEDAARRATTAFWNKGARPGMALTHPGQLSAPAQQRLKRSSTRSRPVRTTPGRRSCSRRA
jgi:phage portal protein BeeE